MKNQQSDNGKTAGKLQAAPARIFHCGTAAGLFFLLLFLLLPGETPAKSYLLTDVSIRAEVLADGGLQIRENRTYRFKGRFSWADYELPMEGLGEVENFSLQENGTEFLRSKNEKPGTYNLHWRKNSLYVKWYYRAKNESRTFTLQYKVTDAVTRYQDVAEFYYKFVGTANPREISRVRVQIILPEAADADQVKAWAHGPLWGNVQFGDGKILMTVSPLPAGRMWEARVTFPAEWVPEAAKVQEISRLPEILTEERRWAEQANEQRRMAREAAVRRAKNNRTAGIISSLLAIIGLGTFLLLYWKFGRGVKVPYYQKVDSELPEEKPAIVNALYNNKQVGGNALSATLFDLANRGFVSLEQKSDPEKRWWGTPKPELTVHIKTEKWQKNAADLADFEEDLLTFMHEVLAEGADSFQLKRFKKKSGKVRKWFEKWKKQIKAHFRDDPFWDPASVKAATYSCIVSGLVIIGGVLCLIFLGPAGLIAMFAGIFLFGLSFSILRYTPEMKLKHRKWEALRRYLKKYHFVNEAGGMWMQQVSLYLIYALALGAGSKAIVKMLESVPAEKQMGYFPWYLYAHGTNPSPAAFAHSISAAVAVAGSTVSSASGAGGGASGGGGGGAGGAAGGAG